MIRRRGFAVAALLVLSGSAAAGEGDVVHSPTTARATAEAAAADPSVLVAAEPMENWSPRWIESSSKPSVVKFSPNIPYDNGMSGYSACQIG